MRMDPIVAVLVQYRRRRKLSQKELSALVGVSEATMGRIENGKTELTLSVYRRILDVLGMTDIDVAVAAMTHDFAQTRDLVKATQALPPNTRRALARFLRDLSEALNKDF